MTADPLVSTEWLAAHLHDANLRILDASYRMPAMRPPTAAEEFAARHIPGAAFFDIDAIADHTSALPHMVPPPEQFAQQVGLLGIDNASHVVVYDAGSFMGGPRAWWMFRLFGHDQVKVLDGGLKKWIAEGRPTEAGEPSPRPAEFHARFDPPRLRRLDAMTANVASGAEQVIDARARDRFEGTAAEPWPGRRSGHIPGSRNLPFNALTNPDGTMKDEAALRALIAEAGVDPARPIVTSCGSGVTAAVITLALARIGVDQTALYDGSWSEWGLPDGPAIATGPA